MSNLPVHWAEGLLLRPHHFQAAERALRDDIAASEDWNVGYAYGLREVALDDEALLGWRAVVKTCHARFRDGTRIRYTRAANETATLSATIPKDAFDQEKSVLVSVAVPTLQLGRRNATSPESRDATSRYLVESQRVADENVEGSAAEVHVRRHNARILIGNQAATGYETLPILMLRRGGMAEAAPEPDPDYIPPVLACDAWPPLQEILRRVTDRVEGLAGGLATQVLDRGIAFESGHREDLERLFRLYALNSAHGYLYNLPYVRGIHPLPAYMELCRLVGMLALFRGERRMPEVPRYDHDDLGFCFRAVLRLLEVEEGGPQPIKRPFIGAGLQLQVRLEPEWLNPQWVFFIGVESKLPFREVNNLVRGELKMKVGSTRQVDLIFNSGRAGVELIPEHEAPRALPGKNWTYWKVAEDSTAWQDVAQTLGLGVRIDESHVEGRIDGQQTILVRSHDGREAAMTFALWAVPTGQAR